MHNIESSIDRRDLASAVDKLSPARLYAEAICDEDGVVVRHS